jgi:hypothetical protein
MLSDKQRLQPLVDLVACLREETEEPPGQSEANRTRLRLAEATLEMLGQGEYETCRLGSSPHQDRRPEDLRRAQASEGCICGCASRAKQGDDNGPPLPGS